MGKRACTQIGIGSRNTRESRCRYVVECRRPRIQHRRSVIGWIEPLAPDLQAAWIYGSVAKQTDTAQSDIDVMLIGEKLRLSKVLELVAPLEAQLGRKINPTCYTPAEFKRRRDEPDSFVNRVLAQPVVPLMGQA